MKKSILLLSAMAIMISTAYAGGDKDKKSCSDSEKKSCCSSKKKDASSEKKSETNKTEEKKPQ
jgi:hypothetical protein